MSEETKKEEVKQEQKQEVATVEHVNMVADLQGGLYSSSDTLRIARNFAQDLSKSTMIPMQYQNNYANCLVALEYANRTGQSPLQVMQSLNVIQGRPSWDSKALIGMINTSGKYDEDLHFTYGKDDKGEVVSCFAWTRKNGDVIEGIPYTMEKAKKEGLLGKNNSFWNKDHVLMLTYRAVSRFASINCPEITLGLYTSEEVRDINYLNSQKKGKASLNDVLADDDDVVICEVVE
ncbi:MAG: recombinase RecT [Bacteroidales bacterium]|nr:recombinase RecT [Bacteroidales bacterium]